METLDLQRTDVVCPKLGSTFFKGETYRNYQKSLEKQMCNFETIS